MQVRVKERVSIPICDSAELDVTQAQEPAETGDFNSIKSRSLHPLFSFPAE